MSFESQLLSEFKKGSIKYLIECIRLIQLNPDLLEISAEDAAEKINSKLFTEPHDTTNNKKPAPKAPDEYSKGLSKLPPGITTKSVAKTRNAAEAKNYNYEEFEAALEVAINKKGAFCSYMNRENLTICGTPIFAPDSDNYIFWRCFNCEGKKGKLIDKIKEKTGNGTPIPLAVNGYTKPSTSLLTQNIKPPSDITRNVKTTSGIHVFAIKELKPYIFGKDNCAGMVFHKDESNKDDSNEICIGKLVKKVKGKWEPVVRTNKDILDDNWLDDLQEIDEDEDSEMFNILKAADMPYVYKNM